MLKNIVRLSSSLTIEFLFPIVCIACRKKGTYLCNPCLKNIPLSSHTIFSTKAIPHLTSSRFCGILSATRYTTTVKKALHLLKYKRIRELAYSLGEIMRYRMNIFLRNNPQEWIIIPLPLHNRKKCERGFNQNDLLTDACFRPLAEQRPIHLLTEKSNPLKRIKDTRSQTRLNGIQRIENVKGAFRVTNTDALKKQHIILVDDVLTTGATIKEAAQTLILAGAESVFGCVVAQD